MYKIIFVQFHKQLFDYIMQISRTSPPQAYGVSVVAALKIFFKGFRLVKISDLKARVFKKII